MKQRYLSVLTAALLALGTVSAYAAAGGNGGNVVVAVAEVTVQAAGRQCRRHVRRP